MHSSAIGRRIGALAAALALATAGIGAPALAAAPAAASPAKPAWTHEASDLSPHPNARFGRLENGFRYVILPNAMPAGGASIRLRMDVGSLHEEEHERGLAHFIEHMAFNGSKNVPAGEFFRRLERIGVRKGESVNAFTTPTQTFYSFDLPAADAASLDVVLGLIRGVGELTLEEKAIDAERLIVMNEKRMREGPPARLSDAQLEFWFQGRRAAVRSPIGTDQVIREASYETIRAFYRRYYRPERAVLVIVGDVDAAALEPKIAAQFGDWRGEGPAGAEPDLGAPGSRRAQAKIFTEAALPPRISLTWVRDYRAEPQTLASVRTMVVEHLGLGVLNRRLERLAAGASPPFTAALAQRDDTLRSGRLTVMQASAPTDGRAALQALILAQRQVLQHGVSEAELAAELAGWRARLENRAFGMVTEPSARLADEILQTLEENGVFTSAAQDVEIFDAVVKDLTPEEVTAELRRMFSGEGPLALVVSPTAIAGAEQTVLAAIGEAERRAVSAPALQAHAWPYTSFGAPGKVAERRRVEDLDATLITFANGVRLTVKPTRFRTGQVLVGVRVGDGRLALRADQASPDWSAGAYVLGGLKALSFEDVQLALAGKVVSVNPSLTDNAFRIDGMTRAEDLDAQMQLLAAYVAEPGWRPEAFERVRTQLATNIARIDGTVGGILQREVRTLMRGGDRRWAQPSAAELRRARLDEVRAVLEPALADGPLEVTIVGDVELEAAIASAAATFGALPARRKPNGSRAAQGPRFPAGAASPVVLRHYGPADQSLAIAAWPVPDFYADPQEARTLRVLEQVIGLRLFDRLRGEQGLAYATDTELVSSEVFSGYGYLLAMAEVKPGDGDKALAAVSEIVADLAAREIDADELERARRPRLEEFTAGRQTNAYWLSALAGAHDDPRRLESPRTLLPHLQAVTAADIRRAAQRHLAADKAWKAQILPAPSGGAAAAL